MATHSSILAWRIPMDRGAWWATVLLCLVTQSYPTLFNLMDCSLPGASLHGDFPGKDTGVGCHALLQGILTTQGSNPGIPDCRHILLPTESQRNLRILEWVAYPFSRGSSQPRNRTRVFCIAGGFFTSWATREVLLSSWTTTEPMHPRAHAPQ